MSRGILLILCANLLFAIVDSSTKWLLSAGFVAAQLAFMRYSIHFAITCVERLVRQAPRDRLTVQTRLLILLRAATLVSATLVNFIALNHLSLAVASSMLYLSPLFICGFAWLLLNEDITSWHWLAIGIGGGGALLILWPFGAEVNWYAALMLYPAAMLALYQVLTRKLASHVRPAVLQFSTGAVGTVALAPWAFLTCVPASETSEIVLLFSIGAIAWAGHEALTRAHIFAEASALAPFGYSFVVFVTIAGFLIFADRPAVNEWIGMACICSAGLLLWARLGRRV